MKTTTRKPARTRMGEVTLEQLDKKLLPLTTYGLLRTRYSEAQATTFYSTPGGRMIGMTRGGKHYAQVQV